MSYQFSVNLLPGDNSQSIWALVTRLLDSGWTKLMDSDGSTYSSSGTQVTIGLPGAHGINNTNAWVRIQDPSGAGGVEYIIQRVQDDSSFRIKYSFSAGFSGGTPSATQVPSATDEILRWGSGSDASPSGARITALPGGTYRLHLCADNAAPYNWYSFGIPAGGGLPCWSWLQDSVVAGTYPTGAGGEACPIVDYLDPEQANMFSVVHLSDESVGFGTWFKYGLSDPSYVGVTALMYSTRETVLIPNGLAQNVYTGNDMGFPLVYARRYALLPECGYKGVGSLMLWVSQNRGTGTVFTIDGVSRVEVRDISFPWPNSTVFLF